MPHTRTLFAHKKPARHKLYGDLMAKNELPEGKPSDLRDWERASLRKHLFRGVAVVGAVLTVVAVCLVGAALSEEYAPYVQTSFYPWLFAALSSFAMFVIGTELAFHYYDLEQRAFRYHNPEQGAFHDLEQRANIFSLPQEPRAPRKRNSVSSPLKKVNHIKKQG
jgi:hypothetical protein